MFTTTDDIKTAVRGRYGPFAAAGGVEEACCAAQAPADVSFAIDHGLYSDEQMAVVPDTARKLSRGCGNPVSFADLAPGETVVDLGCGGGIDVVLAAHQVGPTGSVTGVDMTSEMIERASQSVNEAGVSDYTSFVVADMTQTGLPDASVDVVISNCVINLSPEKDAVYAEIFRILRPGGRLAISDIALSEPIDRELAARFQANWSGCMGGAIPEADYMAIITGAGLSEPTVIRRHRLRTGELAEMSSCPGEKYATRPPAEDLAAVEGTVVSVKFTATKPEG